MIILLISLRVTLFENLINIYLSASYASADYKNNKHYMWSVQEGCALARRTATFKSVV
ncbi:MAG: hypothetical protein ACJASG_000002 [Oleiphilaceae bacterium]|jgi:hypothetical protein